MIYAGLDFSLSNPGLVTYDSESEGVRVYRFNLNIFKVKIDKNKYRIDSENRNKFLIKSIVEILSKCDIIFTEDYAFSANGRITDIAEVLGAIKYSLPETCHMEVVAPTSLKKAVTGKGNASKEKVIAKIKEMGFEPANDDEADATGLVLMAAGHLEGKSRRWKPSYVQS